MAKTISVTITDIDYEEILKDIEENKILYGSEDVSDYIRTLIRQHLVAKQQLKEMSSAKNGENFSKIFENLNKSGLFDLFNNDSNINPQKKTTTKKEAKKVDENSKKDEKEQDDDIGSNRAKKTYTC